MANIILKRGTKSQLAAEPKQDGLLSFTTDDGKIHLDYVDANGILQRKTFYEGKLTIGSHVYDGSEDVTVNIYQGEVDIDI